MVIMSGGGVKGGVGIHKKHMKIYSQLYWLRIMKEEAEGVR